MSDASPPIAEGPVLAGCEDEQIQFLGGVQAFGCLLVISSDWVVQNASANVADLLGVKPDDLVGQRLIDRLDPEAMHALRGKVQTLAGEDDGARLFGLDLFGDGRRFDAALHAVAGAYLLEFEPKTSRGLRDELSLVQPLLSRVRRARSLEQMCEIAARGLWALTGFARVMVYRFDADSSGRVIAESRAPHVEGYMGLHFPATDIPPQARALYTRNLLRIIPDVSSPVSPLVPPRDPHGQPVDLSMAVTRAVSPIHLEYLRNMEVQASMSSSLIRDGELWGLIAFHHPEPLHLDYETRSAVELFTQLLSYELSLHEARLEKEQAEAAHALHERLIMLFEGGADFATGLDALATEIGSVIDFDGMALFSGSSYCAEGLAPDEAWFRAFERHLERYPEGKVFCTDDLGACLEGEEIERHGIGGLMALPVRGRPRQYVMLFRHEVARNVVWAGNPAKMVRDTGRISPRKSFAAWQQTVVGKSAAWTPGERRAAEVLRVTLLELVLRQATETSRHGVRRSQRQEVLISELNHRLRNVFAVVAGLMSQTRSEGVSAATFAEQVGDRLQALARASDRLTSRTTASFTLSEMIREEVAAFAGDTGRLRFEGGDLRLPDSAWSTMSLVVHELVTNSVKHGALSRPGGEITVCIFPSEDGARVAWTETGGPAVRGPRRAGFGTTLVSRAIPHEFGGRANLDFRETGLVVEFWLPDRHIRTMLDAPAADGFRGLEPEDTGTSISGVALVVEDNPLIAMNAEETLRALGASDVFVAGNVAQALEILEAHEPTFALLDMDLGGESAQPVASRLADRSVPYVIASGYDATDTSSGGKVPLLKKPYDTAAISSALRALRVERGARRRPG
ncbi:HWE histidine kinase domain-containing protein [Tranquillimonas alkanivorans]|uniref:histidine kinase n=1 Tax=Tranquillimonas alkanivorans TaxID=441119 RepID=A0A1I5VS34_9RHOB|nr:HWE histidine kinase domain-containing protein [Tranquillimonas alkanivorans]SFQ10275.1 Bacteriophytochrome (light-regulated signal transduction histidine kinase) [Tranquillimonas alkanivorans]